MVGVLVSEVVMVIWWWWWMVWIEVCEESWVGLGSLGEVEWRGEGCNVWKSGWWVVLSGWSVLMSFCWVFWGGVELVCNNWGGWDRCLICFLVMLMVGIY